MPAQLPNEDRLVIEARKGCAESFAILMSHYERPIYRLSFTITENQADAEDVLQETFLKAYRCLGQFRADSRFYTWLARIAINQALMKLRKRRADPCVPLDEPLETDGYELVPKGTEAWVDNPEKCYARTELREILEQAIQELDAKYRVVFLLRDVEECSIEETAQTLGISVPTVKSRLLRARLRLRAKLARHFRPESSDSGNRRVPAGLQAGPNIPRTGLMLAP